jgi:prepilin-type processing-associated H-X9-DG protein
VQTAGKKVRAFPVRTAAVLVLIVVGLLLLHSRPTWDGTHTSCAQNLREIQRLGMLYAEMNHLFPCSETGGIATLQVLLDTANQEVSPARFICPASRLEPAMMDAGGKFRLDRDHCSYEMVPWKVFPSDAVDSLLAFDRTPCHSEGRNVVFLDGTLEFLQEAKFHEVFSRQAHSHGIEKTGK